MERSYPAAETKGINIYSESSLHEAVKAYLAREGDRLEVSIDGKVVDLVRSDGELVEIQTARLDKIAAKAEALARTARVRIVVPIPAEKQILRLDPSTGELLSSRRSPKRGTVFCLFDELVKASRLMSVPGLTLEVLLVKTKEFRTRDGKGSWRRKGDSRVDRELAEVLERWEFSSPGDWLSLLPPGGPWDSSSLGEALGIAPASARKILYCFAKAGILRETGKTGRKKTYSPA